MTPHGTNPATELSTTKFSSNDRRPQNIDWESETKSEQLKIVPSRRREYRRVNNRALRMTERNWDQGCLLTEEFLDWVDGVDQFLNEKKCPMKRK